MLTLSEHILAKGLTLPHGRAKCPGCGMRMDLFAITRDADASGKVRWRCGHCRQAIARAAATGFELTWADIRGQRDVFLQRTDWTQLPDVNETVRDRFAPLRQSARDLTELESPAAAQDALALIFVEAGI